MPAEGNTGALTEREKQTLRLIVRGHDAKSVARTLDLSVHTINERLRVARRKMAVSSSREAARLLFEAETRNSRGDKEFGADATPPEAESGIAPVVGAGRPDRPWIVLGAIAMTLALSLLALIAAPLVPAPPLAPANAQAPDPEVVKSARDWLALIDQDRWQESYDATGASFRKLNTVQVWTDVSNTMRARFGALRSRTFVSQENLPAPPAGYEVVKFRAHYARQAEALETVTLVREGDAWRVVGATIE